MRRRYSVVSESGRRFASVHATTPDEAIQIACRVTGRRTDGCTAECPNCQQSVGHHARRRASTTPPTSTA